MVKNYLFINKLLLITFILLSGYIKGQEIPKPTVLHFKVTSQIDPRTNRFTKLALEYATSIQADYIILELDTYGGALNDADDIRTRILNAKIPIFAFINKDAASAGALISIACDSIYMSEGSSIGAATVVTQDGKAAPDKYQSYMRSIMRSTAEAKNRDPEMAEAMVDEDIQVDSIAATGKVITLSVSEAIRYGFCESKVNDIDDIMKRNGISEYRLEEFKQSTAEKIISFFLNPFISGILILIIIGGIYFELQTPGVGFPVLAAILATLLYLVPNYLNGLAQNWEIVIFFIGIILICIEIFVIPGFGIAGILGMIGTLGALVLVMLNNDMLDFSFVGMEDIFISVFTVLAGIIGAILFMFFGGTGIMSSKFFQKIALQETLSKEQGFTSNFKKNTFIGKKGKTFTVLRPSGKIEIDGIVYDAYTRGNYIEAQVEIEVISEEGTSLKVKEVK